MKTAEILLQKYGDKFVPLERIAADYYAIDSKKNLTAYVANGAFPGLRPFRARPSSQSPWLVDIDNLAEALESRARG